MRLSSSDPYRFEVKGNDIEGWSIDAIAENGDAMQSVGIYLSRQSAVDDLPRLADRWIDDRKRMKTLPAFRHG